MKKDLFRAHLMSLIALCGFMLVLGSCANEDITQKTTDTDADNDKNLTTFTTGTDPNTRTSLDYNTGAFYWEPGDHIYVKDVNYMWQKSSNAPTTKTASLVSWYQVSSRTKHPIRFFILARTEIKMK